MRHEDAREVAWWWCIMARQMKDVAESRGEQLSQLQDAKFQAWWYEREARRLDALRAQLTAELDVLRAEKRKR
jgi:hypothetical protein